MEDYESIVLLLIVILSALAFGRFYCSLICPFGFLQELCAFVLRGKKKNEKVKNYPYKYIICAIVLGALFGGSAILIRYIDPYSIFGSLVSLTIFGIIFTLCVLAIVFFKNRFFCTNICPVGTFFGCYAKNATKTMNIDKEKCVSCKMCEKNCQAGCIDVENKKIDNEMCVKCLKCYSICPKGAIFYGNKKQEFSSTRRRMVFGVSFATLFVAGYLAGVKFVKDTAKKVKDVIFPAGAIDANKMANRCLNCNLCIKNCPNGILTKADETFNTIHIDYKNGEGYCKYDCHKCAEVCPSGAIKRITLEEKQNTRIAMAMIKQEDCIQCRHCISQCPKQAIVNDNGEIKIDGSKCIGCGKCARICPKSAIEIYGIKEQTVI